LNDVAQIGNVAEPILWRLPQMLLREEVFGHETNVICDVACPSWQPLRLTFELADVCVKNTLNQLVHEFQPMSTSDNVGRLMENPEAFWVLADRISECHALRNGRR
jgi:hypothetical protein